MRADWVYLGATEAAVLAGVSNNMIERLVASGDLVSVHPDGEHRSGRRRNLYRLDQVLALVRQRRR